MITDSNYDSGYNSTDTESESDFEEESFVYVYTSSRLKANNIYMIGYDTWGDLHSSIQNIEEFLNTYRPSRFSSEPRYFVEAIYDTPSPKSLYLTICEKLDSYMEEEDHYREYFRCDIDTIKEAFRTEECVLRTED